MRCRHPFQTQTIWCAWNPAVIAGWKPVLLQPQQSPAGTQNCSACFPSHQAGRMRCRNPFPVSPWVRKPLRTSKSSLFFSNSVSSESKPVRIKPSADCPLLFRWGFAFQRTSRNPPTHGGWTSGLISSSAFRQNPLVFPPNYS